MPFVCVIVLFGIFIKFSFMYIIDIYFIFLNSIILSSVLLFANVECKLQ